MKVQPSPEIWRYQDGSQERFLSCPVFETLYEGTRGPGKSAALIADFLQDVGIGWGSKWRGIIFQPEYKHLADVIAKSYEIIPLSFPGARFLDSAASYFWKFPTGERLYFRAAKDDSDYWDYHGHEYPWLGFDELTKWSSPGFYLSMFSVCRSTGDVRMPRKMRATTNPYGVGHNWVKHRFIDPAPRGKLIREHTKAGQVQYRVAIHGSVFENKKLLAADPEYITRLELISDPNKKAAWLYGSWDIVAGGIIDDIFRSDVHVIRPFKIPRTWYVDRGYDWGSSAPFSVGFWAESDGTEAVMADGTKRHFPRGTIFRIAELYGWNGQPNEGLHMPTRLQSKKIADTEIAVKEGLLQGQGVRPGPADNMIFDNDNGNCIADEMAAAGIRWERSDKSPGSRINGLNRLRDLLSASVEKPMEKPGIFIFDTCTNWLRTVPVIPRDPKKPEDADSDAEDHAYDETRYRITRVRPKSATIRIGAGGIG